MKLTNIATPGNLQAIQQQINAQPPMIPIHLSNCELLRGCVPVQATLGRVPTI